jgi:ferrochelatase
MAMRYGSPSLPEVLDASSRPTLRAHPGPAGLSAVFGHHHRSINDAVFAHYAKVRNVPELRLVRNYHDHDGYIARCATVVLAHWETNGRGDKLVMSFHGVPKRTLLLGDPYHCECHKTARLLAAKLHLTPDQYMVTFQSRFGKAEWLQPYTAPTLQQLARDGVKRVDVICPGFTSDCLETLEEIAMEARHEFEAAGGKQFHYIPCLNESPSWIAGLAEIAEQHMIGWPTMMTPAQREAEKKDGEAGRAQCAEAGRQLRRAPLTVCRRIPAPVRIAGWARYGSASSA